MQNQTESKIPGASNVYWSAVLSCTLFIFGGFAIVLSLLSIFLGRNAKKDLALPYEEYANSSTLTKGKIIAYIGLVLNIAVLGLTIWTLTTIGWDAWSDEFVRRWNEGLENHRRQ
ncbi:CCC motif membrane protein [Alteromonas portus]|uniref:CCC motif membrane protein n=1 Tax=Alteromonas portus TaxID=2565549 RepID=UPI003BF83469